MILPLPARCDSPGSGRSHRKPLGGRVDSPRARPFDGRRIAREDRVRLMREAPSPSSGLPRPPRSPHGRCRSLPRTDDRPDEREALRVSQSRQLTRPVCSRRRDLHPFGGLQVSWSGRCPAGLSGLTTAKELPWGAGRHEPGVDRTRWRPRLQGRGSAAPWTIAARRTAVRARDERDPGTGPLACPKLWGPGRA